MFHFSKVVFFFCFLSLFLWALFYSITCGAGIYHARLIIQCRGIILYLRKTQRYAVGAVKRKWAVPPGVRLYACGSPAARCSVTRLEGYLQPAAIHVEKQYPSLETPSYNLGIPVTRKVRTSVSRLTTSPTNNYCSRRLQSCRLAALGIRPRNRVENQGI